MHTPPPEPTEIQPRHHSLHPRPSSHRIHGARRGQEEVDREDVTVRFPMGEREGPDQKHARPHREPEALSGSIPGCALGDGRKGPHSVRTGADPSTRYRHQAPWERKPCQASEIPHKTVRRPPSKRSFCQRAFRHLTCSIDVEKRAPRHVQVHRLVSPSGKHTGDRHQSDRNPRCRGLPADRWCSRAIHDATSSNEPHHRRDGHHEREDTLHQQDATKSRQHARCPHGSRHAPAPWHRARTAMRRARRTPGWRGSGTRRRSAAAGAPSRARVPRWASTPLSRWPR